MKRPAGSSCCYPEGLWQAAEMSWQEPHMVQQEQSLTPEEEKKNIDQYLMGATQIKSIFSKRT